VNSNARLRSWSAWAIVFLLLTASALPAYTQSSGAVAIAKGAPAPGDGIWLSRAAFDELVSEAEANEVRRSQVAAAQALIDAYKERIAELEGRAGRQAWIGRACGVAVGVLGGLYAHQLGLNDGASR